VLVVAIGTFHQTLIDPMVKRFAELGPNILMAGVAQARLATDQQKLSLFSVVWRVAVSASHIVRTMRRTQEIAVFLAILVAAQASCSDCFGGRSLEDEYLGFVASRGHMRFARTMTGFAPLKTGATPRVQSRFPMGCLFEAVVDIFVAGLANLRTKIAGLA
jgi:hypothetical protein